MVRSKNPKTAEIQRLRDKNDALWSKIIRTKFPKCIMCGSKENLQAHHCIVTKGRSSATRWDLNNGVTLCYKCHIHGIHGEENIDFYRIYTHKVDTYYSFSCQQKVITKSNEIFKANKANYEAVYAELILEYEKLLEHIAKYEPLAEVAHIGIKL